MEYLLGILGILVLLFEINRWLRKYWIHRMLEQKKKVKQPRKPPVLRPKSDGDCPFGEAEKEKKDASRRAIPVA